MTTQVSLAAKSRKNTQAEIVQFEPEFLAGLHEIFEKRVAFNQTIGLKIGEISPTLVHGHIAMRPELIGHEAYERIHGGVISAGLDAMGGLAVMAAIGAKHMDEAPEQRLHRFARLGTIDLRVTICAPALAATSSCAHRCCGWARAWPPHAWNSWARTARSCRPARPHISCRSHGALRPRTGRGGRAGCVIAQALQAHATTEPFGYRSCVTKASFAACETYDRSLFKEI